MALSASPSTQIGITSLPPITSNPVDLVQHIIDSFSQQNQKELITLNLATVNEQDGILARTMQFAGFTERGGILVGTDRNSRKYYDVLKNPNVAVTFLFVMDIIGVNTYRQIRVNGIAQECSQSEIQAQWEKQPAFGQVRSVVHHQRDQLNGVEEFRRKYQELVNDVEQGKLKVPLPDATTCLEIIPKNFDFYQSAFNHIADRYVYTKKDDEWVVKHIVG